MWKPRMTKLIIGGVEISNDKPLSDTALDLLQALHDCSAVWTAIVTPEATATLRFISEQRKRATVPKEEAKAEHTKEPDTAPKLSPRRSSKVSL